MTKRNAFTLIELIIVISIIAILIGLLVVGLQYVGASSREKSTRVTLANLQSMLTELEITAGLGRLPAFRSISAPGFVFEDQPDRDTSDAVIYTRDAMAILLAVPANQSAMGQLPPEQLFTIGSTPVLLDAWDNPIVFVSPPNTDFSPSSTIDWDDRYGLTGVNIEGIAPGVRIVNPGGPDHPEYSKYPQDNPEGRQRLQHFRPFWVSAGPDGNFQTHDDNIYSFEN